MTNGTSVVNVTNGTGDLIQHMVHGVELDFCNKTEARRVLLQAESQSEPDPANGVVIGGVSRRVLSAAVEVTGGKGRRLSVPLRRLVTSATGCAADAAGSPAMVGGLVMRPLEQGLS